MTRRRGTGRVRVRIVRIVVAATAVALCACGPRGGGQPAVEQVEEPDDARDAAAQRGEASTTSPSRRAGEIARADLNRVLDAGPGAFLARTEVKARLVKGQFRGWRVVRSPYGEIDLVPGDVVMSVNGRTLEHPVDLERLWRDLRAANAISVDVDRGGQRFALRFAVVPPM